MRMEIDDWLAILHIICVVVFIYFWPNNTDAWGRSNNVERDRSVRAAFMRMHPCPVTGLPRGACPGWQIDHIVPLCEGGVDATFNMQWLSVYQHSLKTKFDVKRCAAIRKGR